MPDPTSPSLGPIRILVAADDDDSARIVAMRLGDEFADDLRTSTSADRFRAEADAFRPHVVVLAFAVLDTARRRAADLVAIGEPERPFVVVLCDTAALADAARFCRLGLFDDYVQAYPVPLDPDRLTISTRVACRAARPRVVATGSPRGTSARAAVRRPTVLVVEDDEVLHQLVAAMLASEDLELVFETDGGRALERVRKAIPDLVLMDINLPGSDGVDITQRMKREPDLAAIPVLMVTGEARRETLLRSLGAGAVDFLVKPFTREALIAKIWKYLPAPG